MPTYFKIAIPIVSLIKSLGSAVIRIKCTGLIAAVSVTSGIASRELIAPFAAHDIGAQAARSVAIRTAFGMCSGAAPIGYARYNVDCTE